MQNALAERYLGRITMVTIAKSGFLHFFYAVGGTK